MKYFIKTSAVVSTDLFRESIVDSINKWSSTVEIMADSKMEAVKIVTGASHYPINTSLMETDDEGRVSYTVLVDIYNARASQSDIKRWKSGDPKVRLYPATITLSVFEMKMDRSRLNDPDIDSINAELNDDAARLRYRTRGQYDKYLDVLMFSGDEPYVKTFNFSSQNGMLILGNGALSLRDTFTVGAVENKSTHNNYSVSRIMSAETIDDTDYRGINIMSGSISVKLCSYGFDNDYFKANIESLEEAYLSLGRAFTRIFNDAAGNFEHICVRANAEEQQLMDDIVNKKLMEWADGE